MKNMMKRIGLISVDGMNYPNLPLMKLSAYHKSEGDEVEWYQPFGERYDRVYMSKVFSFTPDYEYCINADEVVKGGTGYAITLKNGKEVYDKQLDVNLVYEIEHIFPDYSLYGIEDTAYGFLTRGCPRGCKFCIVGKKERKYSTHVGELEEFWSGQKNIVLYDPNILACMQWEQLLVKLSETNAWIDFNQGLDIRMMTEEKMEILRGIKMKEIRFAWDKMDDRVLILKNLEKWAEYMGKSAKSHNAIVYTIVNFDTTFEQDLDRIYTLRNMGFWPYVMIYDKAHCEEKYKDLQRWVNMRSIFASVERFEDYRVNVSRGGRRKVSL